MYTRAAGDEQNFRCACTRAYEYARARVYVRALARSVGLKKNLSFPHSQGAASHALDAPSFMYDSLVGLARLARIIQPAEMEKKHPAERIAEQRFYRVVSAMVLPPSLCSEDARRDFRKVRSGALTPFAAAAACHLSLSSSRQNNGTEMIGQVRQGFN